MRIIRGGVIKVAADEDDDRTGSKRVKAAIEVRDSGTIEQVERFTKGQSR